MTAIINRLLLLIGHRYAVQKDSVMTYLGDFQNYFGARILIGHWHVVQETGYNLNNIRVW